MARRTCPYFDAMEKMESHKAEIEEQEFALIMKAARLRCGRLAGAHEDSE